MNRPDAVVYLMAMLGDPDSARKVREYECGDAEATMHEHECPSVKCRQVWSHSDESADLPHEQFVRAHQCPKCGESQTFKRLKEVDGRTMLVCHRPGEVPPDVLVYAGESKD